MKVPLPSQLATGENFAKIEDDLETAANAVANAFRKNTQTKTPLKQLVILQIHELTEKYAAFRFNQPYEDNRVFEADLVHAERFIRGCTGEQEGIELNKRILDAVDDVIQKHFPSPQIS